MKKSFVIGLLLATSICSSAKADTIFDAMASAYGSNNALQAQRAFARSVDENVALAKSGYRPEVYLAGDYTAANVDNDQMLRDYDRTSKGVSANVRQSIFSGFQTINATRSADSFARSQHSVLYSAEQQILLISSMAYLDVLTGEAIVELQANNEKLLKKRMNETTKRFNVGELTKTDVAQSEASYAQARSDRIAAEGALEVAKATYERIVGKKPGNLSEPTGLKGFLPQNFDAALEATLRSNYDIKAGRDNYNSKVYDVATNTGGLLPSVDVSASAGRRKTEMESWVANDDRTDTLQVGLNMTVPLYDAGRDRARIRQSKYNKWQAHEQFLETGKEAVEGVTSSWETMVSSDARIKSLGEQVRANEIALDGVQKEEAVGNRTVLDVLNAFQVLLNSNVQEVQARRDYYVSAMGVLASMGKLTARALKLNVKLYNPKEHYKDTRDRWISTSVDTNENENE